MNGDVFLKGTLKGRLSIAADNNIDIIGNVTYQGGTGGSDLLGLVANNYVEIYHPVGDCGSGELTVRQRRARSTGTTTSTTSPAGLTPVLQQPHDPGGDAVGEPLVPGAELPVRGRHAARDDHGLRRDRAEVPRHGGHESGSSGYTKSYTYDQRMKYQSPPYFLNPVAAAWQIVTWIECKGSSSGSVPTTCQ